MMINKEFPIKWSEAVRRGLDSSRNILEPGDRVLVVFGAGHLGLLRQAVEADPTLTLRTLEEFVSLFSITSERLWPACREEGRRCLCSSAGFHRSFLSRLALP